MTAPLTSPSPGRDAMPPPKWALTGPHATGAEYELLRDSLLVGGLNIPGGGAGFVTTDAALEELVADANRGAILLAALREVSRSSRSALAGGRPLALAETANYCDAAIARAEQHWAPSPVVEART